jgi:hypothetical protein
LRRVEFSQNQTKPKKEIGKLKISKEKKKERKKG